MWIDQAALGVPQAGVDAPTPSPSLVVSCATPPAHPRRGSLNLVERLKSRLPLGGARASAAYRVSERGDARASQAARPSRASRASRTSRYRMSRNWTHGRDSETTRSAALVLQRSFKRKQAKEAKKQRGRRMSVASVVVATAAGATEDVKQKVMMALRTISLAVATVVRGKPPPLPPPKVRAESFLYEGSDGGGGLRIIPHQLEPPRTRNVLTSWMR